MLGLPEHEGVTLITVKLRPFLLPFDFRRTGKVPLNDEGSLCLDQIGGQGNPASPTLMWFRHIELLEIGDSKAGRKTEH
jgi:hypothetical protein